MSSASPSNAFSPTRAGPPFSDNTIAPARSPPLPTLEGSWVCNTNAYNLSDICCEEAGGGRNWVFWDEIEAAVPYCVLSKDDLPPGASPGNGTEAEVHDPVTDGLRPASVARWNQCVKDLKKDMNWPSAQLAESTNCKAPSSHAAPKGPAKLLLLGVAAATLIAAIA